MPQAQRDRALDHWANASAGHLFLELEQAQIARHIATRGSESPLWLSAFRCSPPVDAIRICPAGDEPIDQLNSVIARESELPFGDNQFHLAISSHVHEYTANPHLYLRELARVIEPEGLLILSGFNPLNVLGMGFRHRFMHASGAPVFPEHFLSIHRLKDWMKLLGFEPEGGSYFYYRPLSRSRFVLDKLAWMETAGERWWPRAGAGFILVARKRLPGMTPLVSKRKIRFWSPAPRPAVASIAGNYEHG